MVTFFEALFDIRRSRMLQIETLEMVNGDIDDKENYVDDEASSNDNTLEIE